MFTSVMIHDPPCDASQTEAHVGRVLLEIERATELRRKEQELKLQLGRLEDWKETIEMYQNQYGLAYVVDLQERIDRDLEKYEQQTSEMEKTTLAPTKALDELEEAKESEDFIGPGMPASTWGVEMH